MERSKQRTLGMEERKPRTRIGGLVVAPCQRGEGTVPVWPRVWRGRPGSSGAARSSARGVAWGPRTRARRWRRPTSGRVAAASSVWRAEWRGRRGRGIGEERKEEDGSGIYMPRPFTPGAIPPPGVKVYLYSRLVISTGSKGFFGGPRNCSPPLLPGGLPTRD